MLKEISTKELRDNPFQMIGNDWLLVTAEKDGKANTMTASWGGVGIMWGKDVAFIVIRPQRYTKEFIDGSDTLSLSVLPDGNKEKYNYLGKVSGRDEDKIAKAELTVAYEGATPYFSDAKLALICKKMFAQPYSADAFVDKDLLDKFYAGGDFHTLYICEITKVLVSE